MAIALLAGTLLALAGFLLTSVQGFALAAHLAAADPAARLLVTQARRLRDPDGAALALLAVDGHLLLHRHRPARQGRDRRLSPRPSAAPFSTRSAASSAGPRPPATFALLSAIAVFVLGGAVHTRALPVLGPPRGLAAAVAHAPLGAAAEWTRVPRERPAHGRSRGLRPQGPGARGPVRR